MPSSGDTPVPIVVLLSDLEPEAVRRAVAGLRKAGMSVSGVQGALGSVTGKVPRGKLAAINKVQGVSAVEESQDYQLPPPDSAVQ